MTTFLTLLVCGVCVFFIVRNVIGIVHDRRERKKGNDVLAVKDKLDNTSQVESDESNKGGDK